MTRNTEIRLKVIECNANTNLVILQTPTETFSITSAEFLAFLETAQPVRKPRQPPKTAFVPPTVEEAEAYATERGNGISGEAFVNWYQSKGWKVGSAPMRDWKAAMITWESKNRNNAKPNHYTKHNASYGTSKNGKLSGTAGLFGGIGHSEFTEDY